MNDKSIKSETFTGIIWSFSNVFFTYGIQFILGIFLARLLLPEDYGLIAMVTIFIAIANIFIDSGFSQALIRKKDVTQKDYSTIFYFNLFIATIIYFIIFFTSKFISDFYSEPRLIQIIRVLSLVIIIQSFSIIQRTILIKKIDFKSQTIIAFFSNTSSGIVAIIFAFSGFGLWSLVINTLISNFLQTILLWIYNRWMPSLTFSSQSIKTYFGFGSKLLISGLVDTVYKNIYSPIIGKQYNATELGYYNYAVNYTNLLSGLVPMSIQKVTYPILSNLQNDHEVLKAGYKKVLRTTMLIQFPLMFGLIVAAEPLFIILFGENWLNSVPYFQFLCFNGMLYPLHAINLNILKVKGRSDLFLRLEFIKKAILTVLILLFFQWGIYGLMVAQLANSILGYLLNSYYSGKFIDYSMKEQLKDILPFFIYSLLMACILFLSSLLLPNNNFIKLGCEVIIGVIFYLSLCKLTNVKELGEIFSFIIINLKELRLNIKKRSKL